MKRKIMQHGPTTLVVSLPSKWVKAKKIVKGDEIDLIESPDGLLIQTEIKKESRSISFDITGISALTTHILGALFLKGYDRVDFKYKTQEEFESVKNALNRFVGLEIVEQKSDMVTVKKLAETEIGEYDNMIRKSFLLVLDMGEECVQLILKKGPGVNSVLSNYETLAKFLAYCRRIMLQENVEEESSKPLMYAILFKLHKLGRHYKNLSKVIEKNKTGNDSIMEVLKATNSCVREYYELFYSFNLSKFLNFYNKRVKIGQDIDKLVESKKVINTRLLMEIDNIISSVNEMIGPTFYLKLKEK